MNIINSSVSFFNTDFSGGYLWIMIILSVIVVWAISLITCIIMKVFSVLKQPFKDLTPYIKNIMENSDDEKKKEEKKKEYENAISRILESENLMVIGRYLTIVISALLLVLVVVIIGLIIIVR